MTQWIPGTRNIRINVIGSANADYSLQVPTLPLPGQTLAGSDFQIALGGKGANQAIACARLGATTRFIASVGDDAAGKQALQTYRAAGLDCERIWVDSKLPTGSAMIFVSADGENCIGIDAGANAHTDVEMIDQNRDQIMLTDYLLMQLETPLAGVMRAADIAFGAHTQCILNPAPAQPLPEQLLSQIDILTPNETELATLTDMPVDSDHDLRTAAQALLERGVGTLIVTRGAAGASIFTVDGRTDVEAPTVTPLDTTAAGDTFNGALVVALSEGQSLIDATDFANRAAALSVTRRGAIDAIPERQEVDAT